MGFLKRSKDAIAKTTSGGYVPRGLFELSEYFRTNKAINFEFHNENGKIVAVSTNFRHGSIITVGKNTKELDANIKDAILTSFEVPSSYAKEASISRVDEQKQGYALA